MLESVRNGRKPVGLDCGIAAAHSLRNSAGDGSACWIAREGMKTARSVGGTAPEAVKAALDAAGPRFSELG